MGAFLRLLVICFLIIPVFLFVSFPSTSRAQAPTLQGDINEDGQVNIFDLLELLKILSNGSRSERQFQLANVNQSADGKVDIFDLLYLLQGLSGNWPDPPEVMPKPIVKWLSNQSARPGDEIALITDNVEDIPNDKITVLINSTPVDIKYRNNDSVGVTIPVWFNGGNIRLIVESDTSNNIYLLLRGWELTPNYDESKVPQYTLPDPLVNLDGTQVTSASVWTNKRRPEILELFKNHVYGRSPGRPGSVRDSLLERGDALGGLAERSQVRLTWVNNGKELSVVLLIHVPKNRSGPVPAFLGLNFWGNHAVSFDTLIIRTPGMVNNPPRGGRASRWPIQYIIEHGYALVTASYWEIAPDNNEGFTDGAHMLFDDPAVVPRPVDAWGNIGAWAWGMSRILDYLETDAAIDAGRVAAMGHSRLGKTALWAGAQDERFAMAISNNSGCVGAALSRRAYGETVRQINTGFPQWFCDKFKLYNDNEAALPVDQHMLMALIAPRPVYVASAESDGWSDQRGEFLGTLNASPVYQLLTGQGLGVQNMPALDQPSLGRISYHIRTGGHGVEDYDWEQYIKVADMHVK